MEDLRILVVDDEDGIRQELTYYLEQSECLVYAAESRKTAIELLEENPVDIAILDIRLGADCGLELLQEISQRWPDVQVIMVTAFGNEETILSALRAGAFDFFHKPFRLIDLEAAIQRTGRYIALQKRCGRIQQDNDNLHRQLKRIYGHPIVGEGGHIKHVKQLIGKVASSPATSVLVTGESGTGKELVARSIHLLSDRHEQRFYPINCSAIPEHLFESELFGHVKGAFTGADSDKTGWIQTADKGTLVLDEIADIPLSLQVKLLRVLETGTVIPVGARKGIPVDVRFIAMTNRDLSRLVENDSFRLDLFYRLNRFEVHLEPLRERREDIEALIEYYLEYFSGKLRRSCLSISLEAKNLLLHYYYPGNVRELRNILERAIILCEGKQITPQHLSLSNQPDKAIDNPDTASPVDNILDLEVLEKKAILRALDISGNNKTHAARLLNITWYSLDRRLKKYGMTGIGDK